MLCCIETCQARKISRQTSRQDRRTNQGVPCVEESRKQIARACAYRQNKFNKIHTTIQNKKKKLYSIVAKKNYNKKKQENKKKNLNVQQNCKQ